MDSSITERRDEYAIDGEDFSNKTKITTINNATLRTENVSPNLWDSLESDTESLVQEKAYQRELQNRILDEASEEIAFGANYVKTGAGGSECGACGDSSSSLEMEPPFTESQPTVTGRFEPPDKSTKLPRLSPLGDEYATLRYDPDWRRNLAGTQFLYHVKTSLSLDSSDEPGDVEKHTDDLTKTGRHEYVVVNNSALAEMDNIQPRAPSFSFHLHPQQNQSSHEDTKLSAPQNSCTSSQNPPRLKSVRALKARDRFSDNQSDPEIPSSSFPQHRQQKYSNKLYDTEDESSVTAGDESKDKLNFIRPLRRHSRHRQPRPRKDIVERNKATLGVNTQKQGSYLKAHGQRGRQQNETNELLESSMDNASTDSHGSLDNVQDPELMWIQKTQKLKIHKESKRSEGHKYQLHRSRPRVHLNPPVERHTSEMQTPSENQMHTPSDSSSVPHPSSHRSLASAPTVNLNINLSTPCQLTEPFLGPELQQHVYTLAPPPPPQWNIRPSVYSPPFIYSGCAVHQVHSAPQVPVSVLTPGHQHLKDDGRRISGEPILRAHGSNNSRIAPEVMLFDEEGRDSANALKTYNRGFALLPPIGRSNASDTELCNDKKEPTSNALHRSSSEGYLGQLEKQRQLKSKTYKAYTLKDYRGLKQEVNLGGLGPSSVDENVAEKIRQQKLYSNVIREQNKKISRIPFQAARNPLGSDNKNGIPRNKALEYAKTIAKPKIPQQWREKPKERSESESVFEHSAYLQLGVDPSQMDTLEMLRKRHEQEKQAVARFITFHGASSTPSVHPLNR